MNGFLLDTHVLLWLLSEPEKLSPEARRVIHQPTAPLWLSAASIWEISIKRAAGRLRTPDDLLSVLDANQVGVLAITGLHALAIAQLPDLHRDPFDRMLVVQAQSEGLTIITRDPHIADYGVPVVMA